MANENKIAFQGLPGAFSDMSCRAAYPDMTPLPCPTFEDTFQAVHDGDAALAMIPIENSVAGRVADIHQILPNSRLHIIAENFQRVQHQLLGKKGVKLEQLETVHSHVHALSQCRKVIRELGVKAIVHADTAGAAMDLAETGKDSMGAIASALAADIYDLDILKENIEDEDHNTTRFVIMAKKPIDPEPSADIIVTSFVFRVRNVPAALYKALGGFATNGINMTKLESYMVRGEFTATQFYADIEGHPDDDAVRLALEELSFFSREVNILGVYPGAPYRVAERKNG
ncbi:MAG TPA: prephenate dehydratase [Rhodospirillaceae bacterium]|nr:prephenate dehydratase [Rhodospirillaceae bacterium]HAA92675.1 prephenate dehydratase [Rhodospirillaceae bacterium]HAT35406.1 prephenate dehydratase [Rhodospirillaceae bacterium]